jgi:hypothetical protein
MKRLLLLPFLLLTLAACGGTDVQEPGGGSTAAPAPAAPATNLEVTVWADPASAAAPTSMTFYGDKAPVGAALKDFTPTTADQPCTEIYGGPGKATVTGTLDGAAVNATFTRSNGCEIARWEKMVQLGLIPAGIGGM